MPVVLSLIALAGCNSGSITNVPASTESSSQIDDRIYAVYQMYVKNAQEKGETPLSYEEWLTTIKGEKGDTGETGAQGEQGPKGEDGKDGKDGVSVVSIVKTSTDGLIDTYTITYSNGSTSTFTVTNGFDGQDGTKGVQGNPGQDGHTPVITISETTGNWVIDGTDTGIRAQGEKGEKGDTGETGAQGEQGPKGDQGKSAYEIYCEEHPDYKGSEEQWMDDLVNGRLRKITITFNTNGGNTIEPITTSYASYITVDRPVRNGYEFVCWMLNGSDIDINTYVFFADCTLQAKWKVADTLTLAFDANGGVVVPGTMTVSYGKTYELPVPTKSHQSFLGWKYETTDIPLTGTWDYTHEDITLTASWSSSKVYINLDVDAEYGAVSTNRVAVTIGDPFALPVPTSIKEGYTFTGWYLGTEKITDEQGNSLGVCEWTTSPTLRASYYIEIATIYDFMALGGQSLSGQYLVTNDLDFHGLGVNAIDNLTGTFDFGGHTLSNFKLMSGVTSGGFSGLFKQVIGATVKNGTIENASCDQSESSGLIGTMQASSDAEPCMISNITVRSSFNSTMRSVLIGCVGSPEKYFARNIIKNIKIQDSGSNCESYLIHTRQEYVINSKSSSGYNMTIEAMKLQIDGLSIENSSVSAKPQSGIILNTAEANYKYETPTNYTANHCGDILIKNYTLKAPVSYGIAKNGAYYVKHDYYGDKHYSFSEGNGNIIVEKSEIHPATDTAWGCVTSLTDSANYGSTTAWGAEDNVRVVDCNYVSESYYGSISSSINLYPDANGAFTYYSAGGEAATLTDTSLLTKEFFESFLGFDPTVWDLSAINIANGEYPHIR